MDVRCGPTPSRQGPIAALDHRPPIPADGAWPSGVATGLVDALGAVVAVDSNLRVCGASMDAAALLPPAGGDSLLRLLSRCGDDSRRLRLAFEQAVAAGESQALLLEPADGRSILCRVFPCGEAGRRREPGEAAALVQMTPLLASCTEAIPHLRRIYGFTLAESDIAADVGSGLEIGQIAQRRGVSIHTLRAQVVSIKYKMNLCRLAQIAVRVNAIATACAMPAPRP